MKYNYALFCDMKNYMDLNKEGTREVVKNMFLLPQLVLFVLFEAVGGLY